MFLAALLVSAAAAAPAEAPAAPVALGSTELLSILKTIDDRQRNSGDYKSLVAIENREKDKADVVYEALVYRRDADDKLMILFDKPKAEQGKGYLRLDKNLWMYDPNTGKWERRTERERIAGTNSRRQDFDESRLADEYDAAYVARETLGKFPVHHLKLASKGGVDVAYPTLELWVDVASTNILKRQEFALSGRLMRTSYYPKWTKVFSASKKSEVWYPEEMHFFDEIEKANATHIVIRQVDLRALDANLFTKAFLESKSR